MITNDEAVTIARARAKEKGWGLLEPLAVSHRRSWSGQIKSYCVESNLAMRGTKTRFTIDAETGAILSEAYIPR